MKNKLYTQILTPALAVAVLAGIILYSPEKTQTSALGAGKSVQKPEAAAATAVSKAENTLKVNAPETVEASSLSPSQKDRGMQVYFSKESEGVIGLWGTNKSDNPQDNLFTVRLPEKPSPRDRVWLSYELDGLSDYGSVTLSVNEGLSFGGYLVEKGAGWKPQRQLLNPASLEAGDNTFLFSLAEDAGYGYRIRNLSVQVQKGGLKEGETVMTSPAKSYGGKVYVAGFIAGCKPSDKEAKAILIGGEEVSLSATGDFESLLTTENKNIDISYRSITQTENLEVLGRADYEYPYQAGTASIEKNFVKGTKDSLMLNDQVKLATNKQSLTTQTAELSITALRDRDLPALDYGMTNVTEGSRGYRFLPHGVHFEENGKAEVSLGYDRTKIPSGYTEEDIKTYYFDTETKHWKALERVAVDREHRRIISETTHFTDMINGVIQAPESPETEGFAPTQFSGMEAADPSAKIELIAPPSANNKGSASLSYGFEVPPARNGMSPSLGIQYSSEGGSGWLGEGWDLSVPSISIDTRWGVPRYDDENETETYLMDGEMLAMLDDKGDAVTAQREKIARQADRQFYPRREGGFAKIIRKGDTPENYTWEITDTKGTKYTYGGNNGVVRGDAQTPSGEKKGAIAEWKLSRVEEVHGDWIEYYYTTESEAVDKDGTLQAQALYLTQIKYGNRGQEASTEIDFDSHTQKAKQTFSGHYGFLTSSHKLLDKVTINFEGKKLRSYGFTYGQGAFFADVLQSLTHYDNQDKVFAVHTMDYYDDVQSKAGYVPFASQSESWNTHDDDLNGGFVNPLSQLKVGNFSASATALGLSKGSTTGGSLYVGVGTAIGKTTSKELTGGASFSYSYSENKGISTLIDINGDGIPDKVYKQLDGLFFRAGSVSGTFGDPVRIIGASDFSTSYTNSTTTGPSFNAKVGNTAASVGVSYQNSKTSVSRYFADVNADGLPDLVAGGTVYFNHIDENGIPHFERSSSATPNPINGGGTIDTSDTEVDPQEQADLIANSPLQDVVRVWTAPYDGTVNISGSAALLDPTGNADYDADAYDKADGVRVAVQVRSQEVKALSIDKGDFTAKDMSASSRVEKGDKIYFRVQSGTRENSNGNFDQVVWNPTVTYTTATDDPNGYTESSPASEGEAITDAGITMIPVKSSYTIKSTFVKPLTTDAVTLKVTLQDTLNNSRVVYQRTYGDQEIANGEEINIPVTNDFNADQLQFTIESASTIAWDKISWKPVVTYSDEVEGVTVNTELPVSVYYDGIYEQTFSRGTSQTIQNAGMATITPSLVPNPLVSAANNANGIFTLTVKKQTGLLYKGKVRIVNGSITEGLPLPAINLPAGKVWVELFSADTKDSMQAVSSINVQITDAGGVTSQSDASVYYKWEDNGFGPRHRQWGEFTYNAMEGRAQHPIDESLLVLPQDSASANPAKMVFIPMNLDAPTKSYWMGADPSIYIKGDTLSASRLGEKDVILTNPLEGLSGNTDLQGDCLQGTGAVGVRKESKASSKANMISATYMGVSGTRSTANGDDEVTLSFEDMNGDGYPDIISKNQMQLTNPLGGFDREIVKFSGYNYHKSKSNSISFGIGGNPVHAHSVSAAQKKVDDAKTNFSNATSLFQAVLALCDILSANETLEKAKSKVYITPSVNVNKSSDEAVESFMDVNGDGLPDKVLTDNKTVRINLGYGFTDAINIGLDSIQTGKGKDISANLGLGYDKDATSWSGGIGLNTTTTQSNFTLMDVNGDGLIDKVRIDGNTVKVSLNRGSSFASEILWNGMEQIDQSAATGESIDGAYTYGFKFETPPIRLVINPSVSVGHSVNRPLDGLQDIDGDGYPDLVSSDREDKLSVTRSTIARTNMLKEVHNPLGGSFTLDYARTEATYDHPSGKWALASVTADDGIHDDGPNAKTLFEYHNGKQDRRERTFLGFGTVITKNIDTSISDSAVYRKSVQTYDVSSYYTQGNLLSGTVEDAQGNKYTQTDNVYYTYSATPSSGGYTLNPADACQERLLVFTPLKYTRTTVYEGKPEGLIASEVYQNYVTTASHGELASYKYSDKGSLGENGSGGYNYLTSIDYNAGNPTKYIYGLPTQAKVIGSDGKTYRQVQAAYDMDYGHLTQLTQILNDKGDQATADFVYDRNGNITQKTLPANSKGERAWFKYQYEGAYQTYVTRIDDNFGYQTYFENFDYRYGLPLLTRDNNNYTLTTTIDDMGRVTSVQSPNEEENNVAYTIKHEYYPEVTQNSEGIQSPAYAITKHYDPQHAGDDIETVSFIDGFGRAIQVKKEGMVMDESHKEQNVFIVSGRAVFDAFGRTTAAYYPVTEGMGSKTTFNQTFDKVTPTLTTYDVLDRALTVTLPDGSVTQQQYTTDASTRTLVTATTDAMNGRQAAFANGSGLTVKTEQYSGPDGTITTAFNYDAINQLLTVTDTKGNQTTSAYDMGGRRLSLTQPDAGTTSFSYDPAGNLTTKQTANLAGESKAITYDYDYNRLTGITYPDNPQNNVKYYYGGKNAPENRRNRLSFIEDATGGQEFSYGRLGEITQIKRTVIVPNQAIATYITKFTYDSWNRLTGMVYPDGEKLTYAYNLGGDLESLTGAKAYSYAYVNKIGYDKFGQRVYMKYCNGAETNYTYDPLRRRLQNLDVNSTKTGTQILNNAYTYDAVSNVLSVVNSAPVPTATAGMGGQMAHNYAYDGLYRLISATGVYTGAGSGTAQKKATYSLNMKYDNLHNIVSKKQDLTQANVQFTGNLFAGYDLGYSYDSDKPHQIKQIKDDNYRTEDGTKIAANTDNNTQKYTYDANGNLIYVNTERLRTDSTQTSKVKERKLLWDEENRLVAIDDNGFISNYWYDYSGERVIKEAGGNEGVFVNSVFSGGRTDNSTFTLYVNPYMVVNEGGHYTKHIYINGQRIVSKLGDMDSYGADPRRMEYAGTNVDNVQIDYPSKYKDAQTQVKDNYKTFEVPYLGTDNNDYVNGQGFCCTVTSPDPSKGRELQAMDANIGSGNDNPEKLQYYYHSDHLGSTSLITDLDGNVVQHVEYIPFGEVFLEERNNTWNSPYLFNAKELDEETGLYYYGSRYYNPRESVWLSVDPPLIDGTYMDGIHNGGVSNSSNLNGYSYCYQNPVVLLDPDGSQVHFGFRLGFNAGFGSGGFYCNVTVSAGVEYKVAVYQVVAFVSASGYGGQQLGTSSLTNGSQYDLTAGAYASMGAGSGSPHNFYTLNYNTPSPFDNKYNTSVTYGQMFTYNSAINACGDGPEIQSEGFGGLRFGDFSLSTNNDAESYGSYLLANKHKQTDAGWTGGIVLNIAGIEFAHQTFTGYWPEFADTRADGKTPFYGPDYTFSAGNRSLGNGDYHQSLNKADNTIRIGNIRGGVNTGGWLQNIIHEYLSKNGKYNFNNMGNVSAGVGK